MPTIRIDDLRADRLLAAAVQATGLDDYGDMAFVEGLQVFLDDLHHEARLSERGAMAQYHDIVRLLSNRLGFERDLKRHPEILDEPIARPIVIIGLPRTGSTKLHRMICADPGVQRLDTWRLQFPAPLSGRVGLNPDPRIALAEQIEAQLVASFPELMARHPFEAHEVDEEMWLLEMTFASVMTSIKTRAPKHRAWVAGRSARASYAYMRSLLQYLQWQDSGACGRPWILKSPIHIGELPVLLETFPDATLVHTHRDPRQVIPSFASLMEAAWKVHSDEVDPRELGNDFNLFWAAQLERNLQARQQFDAGRVLDVYYDDIREHAEKVVADIYAHAGRTLSAEAAHAIKDYERRRPEHHFGAYRYAMEDYGLSVARIEAAFDAYLRRFPRLSKSSR